MIRTRNHMDCWSGQQECLYNDPDCPMAPGHEPVPRTRWDSGPVLPLPNDIFDGEIVIASVWQNDDAEFGPIFAILLTLAKEPPFYTLREITWKDGAWVTNHQEKHPNIVPATDAYVQNGGDY